MLCLHHPGESWFVFVVQTLSFQAVRLSDCYFLAWSLVNSQLKKRGPWENCADLRRTTPHCYSWLAYKVLCEPERISLLLNNESSHLEIKLWFPRSPVVIRGPKLAFPCPRLHFAPQLNTGEAVMRGALYSHLLTLLESLDSSLFLDKPCRLHSCLRIFATASPSAWNVLSKLPPLLQASAQGWPSN